jgi:hypothetical protein
VRRDCQAAPAIPAEITAASVSVFVTSMPTDTASVSFSISPRMARPKCEWTRREISR